VHRIEAIHHPFIHPFIEDSKKSKGSPLPVKLPLQAFVQRGRVEHGTLYYRYIQTVLISFSYLFHSIQIHSIHNVSFNDDDAVQRQQQQQQQQLQS
jgi:hypothetical protein